ncbi:S-layer homology domain-containing protein [Robertmurraya massiliosenegalensis]|uniref:S-layer homology domain-containing protein n=1 Tax=Robertmurraya TaxID=2837507 RepID=UPI0039A5651C
MEGFEDNTFRRLLNVPVEQVLAIASRTLVEKKGYNYPINEEGYLQFADKVNISDWVMKDIALAVQVGLIDAGGVLGPQNEITKAEASDLLYRLFMLLYDIQPASIPEGEVQSEVFDQNDNTSSSSLILFLSVL